MDTTEAYLFLFFDCLMTGFLFPFKEYLVLPLMQIFNGYNMPIVWGIATVAAAVAFIVNYWLGRMALLLRIQYAAGVETNTIVLKIKSFFADYGVWMMIVIWVPIFGAIITVLLGIFQPKSFKTLFVLAVPIHAIAFAVKLF